jgi:hypothetical protein
VYTYWKFCGGKPGNDGLIGISGKPWPCPDDIGNGKPCPANMKHKSYK